MLVLLLSLVACGEKHSEQPAAQALPPKFTPEEVAQSLTLLAREGEKGKERFSELDRVRGSAPYVSDFVQLFPGAEVNYRYFTSPDEPGFDVGVDLYERYEFGMQLPVRWDSGRRTVLGYSEPVFSIWEVTNVTRGPSGTAQEELDPAGERHFGPAGWRALIDHDGDFRALGYKLVTNQPVPGFQYRKVRP